MLGDNVRSWLSGVGAGRMSNLIGSAVVAGYAKSRRNQLRLKSVLSIGNKYCDTPDSANALKCDRI